MIGAFVGLFMVTIFNVNIFCSPYRSYGSRCYPWLSSRIRGSSSTAKEKRCLTWHHLSVPLVFLSLLKAWHYCFGALKRDLSHQIYIGGI